MALGPGQLSAHIALYASSSLWILMLLFPLVRTPLPYKPVIPPDNFTAYTTYTMLDANAYYGAFAYVETGDVLVEEAYEDKTRNSTIHYKHEQIFVGITCTYHVHTVVTGYDSDGTPQGDVYPQLVAPGCGMAVGYRALLITFFFTSWLTCCLSLPELSVEEATTQHRKYKEQFVVIGDGNRRAEGQPSLPDESPSSSRRSAAPDYDQPGYVIEVSEVWPAAAGAAGVVAFHLDGAEPNPAAPPPYQQDAPPVPVSRPRQPRGPRRYLPAANADNAKRHLQLEGALLHTALRTALPVALFGVAVPIGLAIASIACMFSYVNDSGFGETRLLLWPVWTYLATMGVYMLIVVAESWYVFYPLVVAVVEYLQQDGSSSQVLFR